MPKVLVVDDDSVQLSVVEAWLTSAGFEVIPHGSAIGTTLLVLNHQPDVILIDWDMPMLSGPDLVERLAKRVTTFQLRVVFYSGKSAPLLTDLVNRSQAVVLGAIRKSSDGQQFLAQFTQLLEAGEKAGGRRAGRSLQPEVASPASVPPDRRASIRVRPLETDPVTVWVTTTRGEFRLFVEDLCVATPQASGGMRLRVSDPSAREALSLPAKSLPAWVQLPIEKMPTSIQLQIVRTNTASSEPYMRATYRAIDISDELRFHSYCVMRQRETM